MRTMTFCSAVVGTALLLVLPSMSAHAQATRTWVSGVGDDANPCSRTAPCKTFAGAIVKTAAQGEINCLDPGGFGALTITKSITIDCESVSNGGVLVAGTNGFNIAGGTDVIIRGLDFDGLGPTGVTVGINGINVTSATTVWIENCKIYSFGTSGVNVLPSAAGANVIVTNSRINNNTAGIVLNGTTGAFNAVFQDVIVTGNTNNGITVTTTSGHTGLQINRALIANNGGTGLAVSGSAAAAVIGNSMVTGNGTGVSNSGGLLDSYKNNEIFGNGTDGTPITAVPAPGQPLQ